MAKTTYTLYDSMTFPDYKYQEYPKMVDNDVRDPITGHGTGVLVNNKDEEVAYWAAKKGATVPAETEVEEEESSSSYRKNK